jgi:predicted GTPase
MKRVVILGAAGRDFHNFNTLFRNNPDYYVVAFTATQIPDIAGRVYPPELVGEPYPDGIPIIEEELLAAVIQRENVDLVVLAMRSTGQWSGSGRCWNRVLRRSKRSQPARRHQSRYRRPISQ